MAENEHLLDLKSWPSIFVLPTHLSLDELHDVESMLTKSGATLTYDIIEAHLAVGKVSHQKRAILELRARGLWTEVVPGGQNSLDQAPKRRRVENLQHNAGPSSGSNYIDLTGPEAIDRKEPDDIHKKNYNSDQLSYAGSNQLPPPSPDEIRVIKLSWLQESLSVGYSLPVEAYTVYRGRRVPAPSPLRSDSSPLSTSTSPLAKKGNVGEGQTAGDTVSPTRPLSTFPSPSELRHLRSGLRSGVKIPPTQRKRPRLRRESTSEEESPLPAAPAWVRENVIYACCRSTPLHPPNEEFINQLLKIKRIRTLTLDEVGVRAYSTSIASIAAYPHFLKRSDEILSLPGCDTRIANLFVEWKQSEDKTIEAAVLLDKDPVLKVLNLFYDIWGVGAKSAREFYYQRQWRSLDDIIEQGWDSLSRVQQIGLKYYDEFISGVPRHEMEHIANTILEHARRVRPETEYEGGGVEAIIVGGYRRGKEFCGDLDVILTHRDDRATYNLIYDIIASLERDGYITHTLALHLTNSNRDQQTLPYRGETGGKPRFDSLDKALVVWQDPNYDIPQSNPSDDDAVIQEDLYSSTEDDADDIEEELTDAVDEMPLNSEAMKLKSLPQRKPRPARSKHAQAQNEGNDEENSPAYAIVPSIPNPNPHRRVDIIISPFRTIGCAVLGWSGDTTFERDVRRYCKKVHNWKFDSSGVRSRGPGGRTIDLESEGKTWQERERLVMEKIGIGWRPPTERCTR
ncbi:hypothetical protein FQN57_001742 [Myotisia sp. PD_48]|nr:hypothetical protein FQN57_001742 [Myotisia sp. PD_48]